MFFIFPALLIFFAFLFFRQSKYLITFRQSKYLITFRQSKYLKYPFTFIQSKYFFTFRQSKYLINIFLFYGFILSFFVNTVACTHHTKPPNFTWPIKKVSHLSRKFSVYHDGIDFPKKQGTPVLSIAKGTVIYAGTRFSGYGKVIIIEHADNWSSLYAHLHKIQVTIGKSVKQMQKIGEVGSTGRSSAPHLHFELIKNKQPINPVKYLSD